MKAKNKNIFPRLEVVHAFPPTNAFVDEKRNLPYIWHMKFNAIIKFKYIKCNPKFGFFINKKDKFSFPITNQLFDWFCFDI